jgi:hypothetical protein
MGGRGQGRTISIGENKMNAADSGGYLLLHIYHVGMPSTPRQPPCPFWTLTLSMTPTAPKVHLDVSLTSFDARDGAGWPSTAESGDVAAHPAPARSSPRHTRPIFRPACVHRLAFRPHIRQRTTAAMADPTSAALGRAASASSPLVLRVRVLRVSRLPNRRPLTRAGPRSRAQGPRRHERPGTAFV